MSASVAKNCSIFVDGYDLSCAFKELSFKKSAGEVDSTALCTTGDKSFVPTLKEGMLSLTGMYDYDGTNLNKIENVLQTAFSNQSQVIVSSSLGAIAIGGEAFLCRGAQVKHDVDSVINQLIMTTADIHAEDNIFRAIWLFNAAVNSTTTAGTAQDNLLASSNGGVLHFHVFGNDGSITNASVLLEQSTNGSAWTTLISSTSIGASHGAVAVEVAPGATVNRYLKATVSTTGGSASCVAAFYRG